MKIKSFENNDSCREMVSFKIISGNLECYVTKKKNYQNCWQICLWCSARNKNVKKNQPQTPKCLSAAFK